MYKTPFRKSGRILSSNLTWDAHYDQIITKAYSIFGLLRRTFSLKTHTNIKKQLHWLMQTQLLPLTFTLDLNHVMFYQEPKNYRNGFNINNYIKFATGN